MLQLAWFGWGCSAAPSADLDSTVELGSIALALDSVDPFSDCFCGDDGVCECFDGALIGDPVVVIGEPPADPSVSGPVSPSSAPAEGSGQVSTGSGQGLDAGSGLARAKAECKARVAQEAAQGHAAAEAALAHQMTVIQSIYTASLRDEEDFFQNMLNGCGDTIECMQTVEANHKSDAGQILAERDAALNAAQAAAAAAHAAVIVSYNASISNC